jgi:hypothetical protein
MGSVHQLILRQGVEEARRTASGDKNDRLCVDAAYEVMSDEKAQIGVAHAGFAMAALPQSTNPLAREGRFAPDRGSAHSAMTR